MRILIHINSWLRSVAIKPILLIVLLTIGLRFTGLTFDSLWLDEGYQTVVESYGNPLPDFTDPNAGPYLFNPGKPANLTAVLKNFRAVDPLCPPLFAVIMNSWITVFGGSDLALRSLSALISTFSVLAIYLLTFTLFGRRTACMAALLQAISPFDISYAQEARMYSLLILTATLSGGSFILLCTRAQQLRTLFYACVYIIATWALVNTHYTGLFIWAFEIAMGLCLAVYLRNWLLLAWLIVANLLTAGLCLPWYPLFQQAAAIRTDSFYVARAAVWWWPFWGLFVRLPLNWIFFLAGKRVMSFAIPIYVLSAAIIALGFKTLLKRRQGDSFLIVCWCLLPPLGIWLLDVLEGHRVIEITRYVIGTAPAIFLVAAVGAQRALKQGRFGFMLLTLYAAFALANNAYAHVVKQREDWRQAAALVTEVVAPDEILFVSQYYDIVCLDRYLSRPLRQVGISPSMGRQKIAHLINEEIQPSPNSFWILTGQEGDGVFAMVPENFQVTIQNNLGHALHLRRYEKVR